MKGKYLVSTLMLFVILMACSSVSWGAIGVYKWTAGANVPSTISYMLNTNADDVSGAWSVQIEIVPAAGGAAVKTFSYLSPDPMTTKGTHSVVWDGSADGGGMAPTGQYKAVITAKAAPVTGTLLKGFFGGYTPATRTTYYAAAVNKNIGSPWYGCIYLIIFNAGVQILEPDGTPIGGVRSGGLSWGSSSPFGISVDASDNVWIDARSGNQGRQLNVFPPDISHRIYGPFAVSDYCKCCDVTGPTNDAYVLDSECYTSGGAAVSYNRFGSYHGDFTTLPASTTIWDWKSAVGSATESWMVQQVKILDEGAPTGPVIYGPARMGVTGTAWNNGALTKYTMDWDPASANKGKPTLVWTNTSLALGMAIDTLPDGLTFGMCRNIASDTDAFWTFPIATAQTVVNTDPSVKKFGFEQPPGVTPNADTTGWQHNRMNYFRFDTVGNVVGVYGNSNSEAAQPGFGCWAVPDSGSTNSQTTGDIIWSHPQPVIASSNSPVSISSCAAGATGTANLTITCADGLDKVASVTIDFTSLNKAGQGVKTLTNAGGGVYSTTFGVGSGLTVGDYNCPITITSTWPDVPAVTGTFVVKVSSATVSGKVTNSKTGWPIANATVTATTGTPPDLTTTTDAEGNYTLPVNAASYAISASATSYGAQAGGAVSLTFACGDAKTQDLQLDPADVHATTGGNSKDIQGTGPNTPVCVMGTVARCPQQGTGTQGFNGYYFIYDTAYNKTFQGVRVMNWGGTPAQPTLSEGDIVVVEGIWRLRGDLGLKEGYVEPTRPPVIVGTGSKPTTDEFFTSYLGYTFGRYFHAYGKVVSVDPVGGTATGQYGPNFVMQSPTSPTNPALANVRVRVDNPTTTGVTFPAVNQMIHVNGFLAHVDGTWTGETAYLVVAKASDVYLISDSAKSIGEAKALADGSKVGMIKAQATVIGNGFVNIESADRTAGLRLEGTLPTGLGTIGTGDLVDFHGTIAANAQGEKVVTTDLLQRSTQDQGSSLPPLDAIGMSSRAANDTSALGLFIKAWGKVTAVNADNFIISDGGYPIKVVCGATMAKPSVDQTVRVRGAISKDVDGLVLYMRNERADWTTGDVNFQPLPFPGAFGYPREFLVLGPFQDSSSADREYRMSHDFIADASGGTYTELTISNSNPKVGDTVGTHAWARSKDGDHVVFNAVNPAPPELTNVVFYAHIWVYSPVAQDIAMRIGSDDSSKIIVSSPKVISDWGSAIEVYATNPAVGRGETWAQDFASYVPLDAGWNSILIKCENGSGPSGADIQFVDPLTGVTPGYGLAVPWAGLGYLLEKPAP